MKNITISIITIIGLLIFTACEDSVGPTVSSDMDSTPVLTSHSGGESFVLSEEDADEELFTLSWEAPDFGFRAAVTYFIEMDPEGSDFDDPVTFVQTNQTSVTMTVEQVNTRLVSAGILTGVESEINMRIRAHVNENVEDRISETFMLAFTPYEVVIDFPEIYVPGGYQGASGYTNDWSPADAPALTAFEDEDLYEGYVFFANDGSEYKFTAERNWDDGDWGGSAGSLEPGGPNLAMEEAGYYRINVNLDDLTYSTLRTTWGVIGDATGSWDADQDMTYDADAKVWRITMDLSAGEMKFRANNDWDLNYGDNVGDGTLQDGGDNIPVDEAGNYTIELDLSGYPYSYSVTQN